MKRLGLLGVVFCSLLVTGTMLLLAEPAPQEGPVTDDLKPIMKRKLDYSKALLEALAVEDYAALARNAQSLSLLSLESNWQVMTTEEYLKQSADFRRGLEVVRSAAKEENIDRAALGYVDVTIRCVECHKYLRSAKGGSGRDQAVGE